MTSAGFYARISIALQPANDGIRPGAFYPFVNLPVSRYTDKTVHLGDVFGEAGNLLETAILAALGDEERIELAEAFLRS